MRRVGAIFKWSLHQFDCRTRWQLQVQVERVSLQSCLKEEWVSLHCWLEREWVKNSSVDWRKDEKNSLSALLGFVIESKKSKKSLSYVLNPIEHLVKSQNNLFGVKKCHSTPPRSNRSTEKKSSSCRAIWASWKGMYKKHSTSFQRGSIKFAEVHKKDKKTKQRRGGI